MLHKKGIFNNQGFTLMEVLASITLLSIIVLTFLQLFAFTNKVAVENNNKLVAVHLAKAMLERVKIEPGLYIDLPLDSCPQKNEKGQCLYTTSYPINGKNYEVLITANQKPDEKAIGLIHIVVETRLQGDDSKVSSKVEGYVSDEEIQE